MAPFVVEVVEVEAVVVVGGATRVAGVAVVTLLAGRTRSLVSRNWSKSKKLLESEADSEEEDEDDGEYGDSGSDSDSELITITFSFVLKLRGRVGVEREEGMDAILLLITEVLLVLVVGGRELLLLPLPDELVVTDRLDCALLLLLFLTNLL